MAHSNPHMSYKVKALVNDLSNAASATVRSNSAGKGVNIAATTNYTAALIAVAVGSRKLPDNALCLESSEIVSKTQREAVLSFISEVGEIIFINQQNTLKWSESIMDSRADAAVNPCCYFSSISPKDFVESVVPGCSTFVGINLERTIKVVDEYISSYYLSE